MDVCDRSFEVVENNEHGERNEEEEEFSVWVENTKA